MRLNEKEQPSINNFLIKTTEKEKHKLDLQVARFIFSTNSPFRHVEHPEFKKLLVMMRPGYCPPNRKKIANELLDEIYSQISNQTKKQLENKVVCMSQDGWSNIRNESIICVSVTEVMEKCVHLCHTIDTQDNSHTAEYLLQLAVESIKACQDFKCIVRSFVTDNAANMAKMRNELSKRDDLGLPDILTYGCSAHILNLLAQDLEFPDLKCKIKKVIKYFRNTHFAASKYKQAGGKALVLPQDVRWNTLCNCLESYIDNWHILSKVCSEYKLSIDTDIIKLVNNMDLKINCEEYYRKLKFISVSLDKMQRDDCVISEGTQIWLDLLEVANTDTDAFSENDIQKMTKRFKMAMTPAHFLSNILDHRFRGNKLNAEQVEEAMEYVANFYPNCVPVIMAYQAKVAPFKNYLFLESSLSVKPITWWLSIKNHLNNNSIIDLVMQLHTAVASSAGIERLFSAFGLVHSKLRNRLGVEKTAKLVTVLKALNHTNGSLTNLDIEEF